MKSSATVIAILAIAVLSLLIVTVLKRKLYAALYAALMGRNLGYFFAHVDGGLTRAMVPIFSRESLRLSAYIQLDEPERVKEQFNSVMKLCVNDGQRINTLTLGHRYYEEKDDRAKSQRIFEELRRLLTKEQLQQYQQANRKLKRRTA